MKETYKIHAYYILGILISIIIILIVVNWGEIEDLVGYIDFAATVTALAVGVLAIIYTILSNTNMSQNSAELKISTKSMIDSSDKINYLLKSFERKIDAIPAVLKQLETKTQTTIDKIDELKTSEITDKLKGESQSSVVSDELDKKGIAKALLDKNSVNGNLLLYIFSKSFRTSKQFNISEIIAKQENDDGFKYSLDFEYSYGMSIILASIELIDYQVVKNSDQEDWLITTIENEIKENSLIRVRKYIEEEESKDNSNLEVINYLNKTLRLIDDYFK